MVETTEKLVKTYKDKNGKDIMRVYKDIMVGTDGTKFNQTIVAKVKYYGFLRDENNKPLYNVVAEKRSWYGDDDLKNLDNFFHDGISPHTSTIKK